MLARYSDNQEGQRSKGAKGQRENARDFPVPLGPSAPFGLSLYSARICNSRKARRTMENLPVSLTMEGGFN
jgi:hypothetical protein